MFFSPSSVIHIRKKSTGHSLRSPRSTLCLLQRLILHYTSIVTGECTFPRKKIVESREHSGLHTAPPRTQNVAAISCIFINPKKHSPSEPFSAVDASERRRGGRRWLNCFFDKGPPLPRQPHPSHTHTHTKSGHVTQCQTHCGLLVNNSVIN